jgi:hypothetical protein
MNTISRRSLLVGGGVAGVILAAPAIIRVADMMPVRSWRPGILTVTDTCRNLTRTYDDVAVHVTLSGVETYSYQITYDVITYKIGEVVPGSVKKLVGDKWVPMPDSAPALVMA